MKIKEILGDEFHRLFLSFEGSWNLQRSYSDGSVFEGGVTFTKIKENNYSVRENGLLSLPGKTSPMIAKRKWNWQLVGTQLLNISYPKSAGGALYHALKFEKQEDRWLASDLHHCTPDEYFGQYILRVDKFEIKHIVSGPKKDYHFEAEYKKV